MDTKPFSPDILQTAVNFDTSRKCFTDGGYAHGKLPDLQSRVSRWRTKELPRVRSSYFYGYGRSVCGVELRGDELVWIVPPALQKEAWIMGQLKAAFIKAIGVLARMRPPSTGSKSAALHAVEGEVRGYIQRDLLRDDVAVPEVCLPGDSRPDYLVIRKGHLEAIEVKSPADIIRKLETPHKTMRVERGGKRFNRWQWQQREYLSVAKKATLIINAEQVKDALALCDERIRVVSYARNGAGPLHFRVERKGGINKQRRARALLGMLWVPVLLALVKKYCGSVKRTCRASQWDVDARQFIYKDVKRPLDKHGCMDVLEAAMPLAAIEREVCSFLKAKYATGFLGTRFHALQNAVDSTTSQRANDIITPAKDGEADTCHPCGMRTLVSCVPGGNEPGTVRCAMDAFSNAIGAVADDLRAAHIVSELP